MKIISIHQPLLLPHFPFIEKIYYSDLFVSLINCQSEKGSCLNRQKIFDRYWTKPINKGDIDIKDKTYVDGQYLVDVNMALLNGLLKLFNIQTPIVYDFPTNQRKTKRLIEICAHYDADHYLAAEKAPDKYLDVDLLKANNINFVPFKSYYTKSTIEMLTEFGIEGCMKILVNGKRRFDKLYRGDKQ